MCNRTRPNPSNLETLCVVEGVCVVVGDKMGVWGRGERKGTSQTPRDAGNACR